jgi:hypothetical protein
METIGARDDRPARYSRPHRANIDTIAEAHQATVLDKRSQSAKNLIPATQVGKIARQEDVGPLGSGDAIFNSLFQCLRLAHAQPLLCKNPTRGKGCEGTFAATLVWRDASLRGGVFRSMNLRSFCTEQIASTPSQHRSAWRALPISYHRPTKNPPIELTIVATVA